MKQQTAVEKAIDLIHKDFEENGRLRFAYVQKVLNEAKEIEKQQIIDAWENGYKHGACVNEDKNKFHGIQYYNETTNKD
jgi:hypothetical protein